MRRKVVVLSTADYASPTWTNKQFIGVGLAQFYDVHYIESLGLRQPQLKPRDLRRLGARLLAKCGSSGPTAPGREVPAGLTIHSPVVIPFHRYRLARWINRKRLDRLIRRIGVSSHDVLWTFSPLTYGIGTSVGATVYHSVDLLHTIPGIPGDTLLEAEAELIRGASAVIASSSGVSDHLKSQGATSPLLWENVASTGLYAQKCSPDRIDRAIFAGHFTPSKVDASLLLAVLQAGIPLALAGPIAIDGTSLTASHLEILDHPLTTYLGNLGPERLAEEVGLSKVGLIPYLLNDYTAGVFPMKVYEYLAGGLSVVSTALPSLLGSPPDGVAIVSGADFASSVADALQSFTLDLAHGRTEYAQGFSWERRLADATDLVATL